MEIVLKFLEDYHWENLLISLFRIAVILIVVWLVTKIIERGLQKLEKKLLERGYTEGETATESAKRAETLTRLIRQGVVITSWTIAILIVLRELGVDIAPILASAGILGLAVGFGAQNLVRDVISGFFIILENQLRVGDVAIVNGTGGLVEQVNFRTVVLRDLSGIVHVFPNGAITTMSNLTQEWSAYVFDIGVAYKEDVDRVMDIMKQVGAELRADEVFGPSMIDDVEIFGVDKFADSAVQIKGRLRTQPIKQWEVGREYLRRIKIRFDEQGIEIPFPHRSIYFGEVSKPIVAQLLNNNENSESGSGSNKD